MDMNYKKPTILVPTIMLLLCSCLRGGEGSYRSESAGVTEPDVPAFVYTSETSAEQSEPDKPDKTEVIPPKVTPPEPVEAEFPENIDAIIAKHGDSISVHYTDIANGRTYFWGQDRQYHIASIVKAPYALYIYRLALEGRADLGRVYTYEERHFIEGTGSIKDAEVGTQFTLEELLNLSLRKSDNIALRIIAEQFPSSGYLEFVKSLGIPHPEDVRNITNGRICVRCAAVYIDAVYNFIEEDNLYSERLGKHMLSTTNAMIRANHPIARKYG
ncbi:MAG: class A beta-lactamase-related serine hydrolase [Oscillospiraceae bacterium]|nr:class A beta-lactamase-related serine hydrolase [Oscillospiraceae bacterium]